MSFVSFAQNFEDVILWRALHDVKAGKYIDIGAQDPEIDSVSLAFYNAGWRGIHVEPTTAYAARLRDSRPDEIVIEAAVTDDPGPINFYEIGETGLSTGRQEIAEKHRGDGYSHRKITVPCIRLDALLELAEGEVHWLKIDVEGMEADVLRSWGESSARPWVVVIEATLPNTQVATTELWIEGVLKREYEPVFFDGLSCYFLHKSRENLAPRFEAPANVFDAFVVAPHHFTATEMRVQLDSTRQRLDFEWARAEQNAADCSEARSALQTAREEQRSTLERLLAAEQAYRSSTEEHFAERIRIQHQSREREEELRRDAFEERAAAASVNAELALFKERSEQLRTRLELSEQAQKDVTKRADESERELRAALEGSRQELNRAHSEFGSLQEQLRTRLELSEQAQKDVTKRADESERELRAALEGSRQELDRAHSEFGSLQEQLRREREETISELERGRVQADSNRTQVEHLRFELARAVTLIRCAAAQRAGAWQRFREALGFASSSDAHAHLLAWVSSCPVQSALGHDEAPARQFKVGIQTVQPLPDRNPYIRASSLSELLAWDDVDFVRCAYVTILGRQPDPGGEAHYTSRLRQGRSKMEVLRDLRRSPEGPRHDPGISGLDRALKRARWLRYPLIRPFVRKEDERSEARSSLLRHVDDSNLSPAADQLAALNQKMEQMQQSLLVIEGSFVARTDEVETLVPLDRDSFMRRLGIAARDFESATK